MSAKSSDLAGVLLLGGKRGGRPMILAAALVLTGSSALGAEVEYLVKPKLATPQDVSLEIEGFVGRRLQVNMENWDLRAPDSNPALTEMFYDRDRKPGRNLLPWSGEFVGKHLCSAILHYRLLRDPRQKQMIDRVVRRFLRSQAPDGYLGPFNQEQRLTGKNWDVWGHYWVLRALLLYHEEFGSQEALAAATRAANLLVDTFLDKDLPLTNDGSYGQMNYAVIHAFTKLHRIAGKPQYLQIARQIVRQWDQPGGPLYMKLALAGKQMYEMPGNRWESLHDFQGMYEMFLLTGEGKYRQAFTHLWYSILQGDRHNTGGFTSGERTTGNPYDLGAIETCCTVAWIDMSINMLKLTGNSLVADELELSTFNGNIGGQNPAGNWWTYDTPMDGTKKASFHSIGFQCRPGSPELNCCSVNGPRGLGLISEWAVMESPKGFFLNYYGPATFGLRTPGGQKLELEQQTGYPVSGKIAVRIALPTPERLQLNLRIPAWSAQTRVTVNGEAVSRVRPGSYLSLDRTWQDGDKVDLDLDLSPHYWVGERELYGKTSIYRGPLLLAFDPVYNSMDPHQIPEIDARGLAFKLEVAERAIQPWVLVSLQAGDGSTVRLCDFATAGAYGNEYRTWLPVRSVRPVEFDRQQPSWVNRVIVGDAAEGEAGQSNR